jgi:hypothetical protein
VHHRTRAALAAFATSSLLVAACGDDADADAGEPDDTTETTGADPAALDEYCDAGIEIEASFASLEGPPTDEHLETIAPLVERWAAAAPPAIAEEAAAMAAAYGEGIDAAIAAFEDIGDTIAEHDIEACDVQPVAVEAADFTFDGEFPTEAGRVSFQLTNTGQEPHVLVIGRLRDDAAGTAEEVFAGITDEAAFEAAFEDVTSAFAAPGEEGTGTAELDPGSYIAFCPIPVGSAADAEGEGPPHFTQGMVAGFEVR